MQFKTITPSDQEWHRTKLSLERPYKDDEGNLIPNLLDIAPDGQFIYEPREEPDAKIGEQFRRIFIERGINFFDLDPAFRYKEGHADEAGDEDGEVEARDDTEKRDEESHPMSPEELRKMREEIVPRLHIALGEMSQARDLLSTLASSSASAPANTSALSLPTAPGSALQLQNSTVTPNLLSASIITPASPILSVQAFDAQLVSGGKDEALRNASNVLRSAADGIERTANRSEGYFADALRLRKMNWSLVPAPLPLGAPAGKGADKTSKDFLISYGLENSPPIYRRQAIAHMIFFSPQRKSGDPLVFPHSDSLRLRTTLRRKEANGQMATGWSSVRALTTDTLDGALGRAQIESLEREIFNQLIIEAGDLASASARVSERFVAIDAVENIEIRFDLLSAADLELSADDPGPTKTNPVIHAMCELIASSLPIFLLRQHEFVKSNFLDSGLRRANEPGRPVPRPPPMLQPIIDLLQYQVFLDRIRGELTHAVDKLREVKVDVDLRFWGSSDSVNVDRFLKGKEFIGGEALLRLNNRRTVRFTFEYPSNLTVHLSQATVSISSIPQLTQILIDEIESSMLVQICDLGAQLCEPNNGTWFVDEMLSRAVGRWEGCALNFRVKCASDLTLDCHAIMACRSLAPEPALTTKAPLLGQMSSSIPSRVLSFSRREDPTIDFFTWLNGVINEALSHT